MIIKPTVGRKVWFRQNHPKDSPLVIDNKVVQQFTQEPMDATVLCTWSDRCVNLLVVDHAGVTHAVRSVTMRQEGDPEPTSHYCDWMPYQTGQAKKYADTAIQTVAPAPLFPNMVGATTPESALEAALRRMQEEEKRRDEEAKKQAWGNTSASNIPLKEQESKPTPAERVTAIRNTVTLSRIQSRVVGAEYVVMPDGRTTICQLTLVNGFTVRGESSCVDIKNFNKALGEKYAYENAIEKCWQLEGYLLAEEMNVNSAKVSK